MKKFQLLLLIISLASFISFISCDEEDTRSELDKLPPITTTGENTFGCLVNGKAWVPRSSNDFTAYFQKRILSVGGGIESPDQNIDLLIFGDDIYNIEYDLTDTIRSAARFNNSTLEHGVCWYDPEHTIEGSMEILNFDKENLIISGTFNFMTFNQICDTIIVTDGRFDLKYIP